MNDHILTYLLLGSNLGDRKQVLTLATEHLQNRVGSLVIQSSIYETAPWGVTNQPSFLNQVIGLETSLEAKELLQNTQQIEQLLGRERKEKWGARVIDIDILYYGHQQILLEGLTIPHPFLQERRFTLVPLAEIAPNFVHPRLHLTNQALLEQCTDDGVVHLI
ncbi:MAG: 2-amino-4-hydroxy-6-hydroxymethyldihydropteridine diphosphokinase [Bacteroidota bacterium]